jgi:hypothetical protein
MTNESYADSWDAERAYKRTKSIIVVMQGNENPMGTIDLCELRQVRISLCANGGCPADLFEQALTQLHKHNEIAYGNQYAAYPSNRKMATRAIEWVADRDDPDTAFIGRMNQLLLSGVFDDE